MNKIEGWIIVCVILMVTAAFFYFFMNGYTYISYTLIFAALLIFIYHKGSPVLFKITAVISCVGLLYFSFVEFLVISQAQGDKDPGRSYLIVLGARVMDTHPSLSLQHRLEGALDYLNQYPDSIAVVSGGSGEGENITEAECMRRWLTENGIAEERILKEDRSTTTMENLQFSWEILQKRGCSPDDVAILSSNYHLYRAKEMAKKLGMDPAGVKGNVGYPIYTLGMFIREAFGITHFWVFGY
ncbi:MAG: YdcF family protein [Eubacteriales bacterium]|nr:YdcF family protein [Eubacteriales bacterium]